MDDVSDFSGGEHRKCNHVSTSTIRIPIRLVMVPMVDGQCPSISTQVMEVMEVSCKRLFEVFRSELICRRGKFSP